MPKDRSGVTDERGRLIPRPAEDYGFFGPGSVTWKVWAYPTSIVLGFSRAVAVEFLDPFLAASVDASSQVKDRTRQRYDRTMQYFATVMFGDARSVLKASDTLMKIHARSVGPEPVTGRQYDANDPDSQLWIHLTAWHSILYVYERFGPGRLSPTEELAYWEECARAARFQTIDPDAVPRSREGVRAYFESYRAQLVATGVAQEYMDLMTHLVEQAVFPGLIPNPFLRLVDAVTVRAVKSTFPLWIRRLAGWKQSRLTDAVVRAVVRPVMVAIGASTRIQLWLLGKATPLTWPVAVPVLLGTPAKNAKVWTVDEARAAFGHEKTPREQYAELLEARAAGQGPRAYERHHRDELLDLAR